MACSAPAGTAFASDNRGSRHRRDSGARRALKSPLLLDTSIAILLRDGDPDVLRRFETTEGTSISIVTQVELEGGVLRLETGRTQRRVRLDHMYASLEVLPFGTAEAEAYRQILEQVGYSRRKLIDRMIAAQALVRGAVLITRNGADFKDIPGLQIDVW